MPPKKDAFADLFQSASSNKKNGGGLNTKLDKLSLSERQKLEQQQQQQQQKQTTTSSLNSSWSNLDILSPHPTQSKSNGSQVSSSWSSKAASAMGSASSTPTPSVVQDDNDDPFAIFNKPRNGDASKNTVNSVSTQTNVAKPQEVSLLDDDFTDLFPEQRKQEESVERPVKSVRPEAVRTGSQISSSTPSARVNQSRSSTPRSATGTGSSSASSSKDHTIAALVDIGFSIEDANDATSHSGTDLQKCVNYIMNKNTNSQSNAQLRSDSRNRRRTREGAEFDDGDGDEDGPDDDFSILGKRPDSINFNELGNNLFQKANTFLSFSKKKVMENIEQFNNARSTSSSPFDLALGGGGGGGGSGAGNSGGSGASSNANLPEWMRNQAKYKSQAYEKRFEGGEDYGEDEDNINEEEIDRFMRAQREKERQRMRSRFDQRQRERQRNGGGGDVAEGKDEDGSRDGDNNNNNGGGGGGGGDVSPSFASRSKESSHTPPKPPRPTAAKSFNGVGNFGGESLRKELFSPASLKEKHEKEKETEKKQERKEDDIDLLGISTFAESTLGQQSASTRSHLRDTNPLNQFIETDYTTHKTKATEAFKNGDYATALESYSKCLSVLPSKHELRVVVNSNLALTNKLQGHLKQSLDHVEQALELMELDECNRDNSVGGVSQLGGKPVKYWYLKVVMIKAEVLELLEKYELALQSYNLLVQRLGCVDKKVMDGKRRVDRIVNPDNYKPKPKPKQATATAAADTTSTSSSVRVTPKTKPVPSSTTSSEVELDPLVVDQINDSIKKWAQEKNNDLRQMMINLQSLIPLGSININEKLLTLTLNDLVLPKQVKLNYMKVISSIHPDKLASQLSGQSVNDKRVQLICNGVFINLNECWEVFRKKENI
ncbi:SWA2 [Candida theae]|uniref:SWA2 n=1 Tax=Candida theae TaxID=1198502 RepID=A0AAD5FWZ7_9ASCO|nr:SWA2 [Candida theae]KAI5950211.1 SWA2 [Candida theae]